jgi:hypothetical protein
MLPLARSAASIILVILALSASFSNALGAASPRLVIKLAPSITVGGDCNNPAVWVGDRVHVFASPYADNGLPAGVAYYCSGDSIETLDAREPVDADRSIISAAPRLSYGPWFESVIADDDGVLWAYYHAEFGVERGLHPRIGAQVSYDAGATWSDLGVIIDLPDGSDAAETQLAYGFVGGNGDFSAILDRGRQYVYFFISQYGASADTQGIAVARMRWTDRASPLGKVWKKSCGTWLEPGLGGAATPFLPNLGDAHGVNAPIDFWWGPSIHWNHHLECYVILLNRSTTGGFTTSGPANWVMYGTDLTDPASWTAPVAIDFPNGHNGGWYPVAIGTEKYETDNYLGRDARIFVAGSSHWRAQFIRADEVHDPVQTPTRPQVAVYAGDGSSIIYLQTGDTLPIASLATDGDGDMFEHWLELCAPSGVWSWEGWLTSAPWDGAIADDNRSSTKSVNYTFTVPGEYVIRATAIDPYSNWILSNEVRVHVSETTPPPTEQPPDDPVAPPAVPEKPLQPPTPPEVPIVPPSVPDDPTPPSTPEGPVVPPTPPVDNTAPALPISTIAIDGSCDARIAAAGATLIFTSVATDANGDMLEHWIELYSPDRSWSWEGWLTSAPWLGDLDGNGSRSAKTAAFTFNEPGSYLIRSSAVDTQGQWVVSTELSVTISP